MLCISLTYKAKAFDTKGHTAIEAVALKLLRVYPNGAAIIDSLGKWGFLKTDGHAHSQYTDLSFERQFSQNRQMFHFMSSNAAVMNAIRSKSGNVQQALLLNTLPECLEMMYFFFREIIECPAGASQSGRGTYVLMHIIADSYSTEHTNRDVDSFQLITIKGWSPSRLWWPAIAKQREPGKKTMLLLHRGFFNAKGDGEWKGNDNGLSPLAMEAAKAIRDMLLLLYHANGKPLQADALIRNFFDQYYHPHGVTVTDTSFIFPAGAGTVRYTYSREFTNDSIRKNMLFQYDRYPRLMYMATMQTGFFDKFIKAYGIEISTYKSPGAADKSRAAFTLLPLGIGGALTKMIIPEDKRNYFSSVRTKAFGGVLIALPLINSSLNPYGGIAIFPFSTTTAFSALYGADITFTMLKDFGSKKRNTKTFRISAGYEHDNWGQSSIHTFKIKLGFSTWQGRKTTCPKRRSGKIKVDPKQTLETPVRQEN